MRLMQGKYLSTKYIVRLYIVYIFVPFCTVCMQKIYMYICIWLLSIVGPGV